MSVPLTVYVNRLGRDEKGGARRVFFFTLADAKWKNCSEEKKKIVRW